MNETTKREYEAYIRANLQTLYQKASAKCTGEEGARQLLEDSVVHGAKRFAGLQKKALIADVFEEQLGKDSMPAVLDDGEALLSRAMARYEKAKKRLRLMTRVGALFLSLLFCTVLVIAAVFAREAPLVPEITLIENADVVSGEADVLRLVNYMNIDGTLKRGEDIQADIATEFVSSFHAVTAPNGETYFVYSDLSSEAEGDLPFSLYRVEREGIKEIGVGKLSAKRLIETVGTTELESFWFPPVSMIASKHSDLYLFTYYQGDVVAYRMDAETQTLSLCEDRFPLPEIEHYQDTLLVSYDPNRGNDGTAYIFAKHGEFSDFICFDLADEWFSAFALDTDLSVSALRTAFCADGDVLHVITERTVLSEPRLFYHRIEAGGKFTTEQIASNCSLHIRSGGGNAVMDESGTIHLVVNSHTMSSLLHCRITPDGEVSTGRLTPLYYENTVYAPYCGGVFKGSDGEIYYIEYYDGAENFISIGKLDQTAAGVSAYTDAFDLPDNISANLCLCYGANVFFQSGEDLHYFYIHPTGKEHTS